MLSLHNERLCKTAQKAFWSHGARGVRSRGRVSISQCRRDLETSSQSGLNFQVRDPVTYQPHELVLYAASKSPAGQEPTQRAQKGDFGCTLSAETGLALPMLWSGLQPLSPTHSPWASDMPEHSKQCAVFCCLLIFCQKHSFPIPHLANSDSRCHSTWRLPERNGLM